MPRRRRQRSAESKKQSTTAKLPSKPEHWLEKFSKYFLGVGSAVVSVLGFAVLLCSLYPTISIEVGPQLDEDDSLSVPFVLTNEGMLPLFSVSIECKFERVDFQTHIFFKNVTAVPRHTKPSLAPRERMTGPCHEPFRSNVPINRGSLTIIVNHYPFIWMPPMLTSLRSFQAFSSDTKTVWLPR